MRMQLLVVSYMTSCENQYFSDIHRPASCRYRLPYKIIGHLRQYAFFICSCRRSGNCITPLIVSSKARHSHSHSYYIYILRFLSCLHHHHHHLWLQRTCILMKLKPVQYTIPCLISCGSQFIGKWSTFMSPGHESWVDLDLKQTSRSAV